MKYRNYFVLLLVYVLTIVFVFYCSKVYFNSSNDSSTGEFIYSNNVTSLNYDVLYKNVYNYSQENTDFVIYVSSKLDSSITGNMLFIDSSQFKSYKVLDKLISSFGYSYSVSKNDIPFYIVFKDGKIVDIAKEVDF